MQRIAARVMKTRNESCGALREHVYELNRQLTWPPNDNILLGIMLGDSAVVA